MDKIASLFDILPDELILHILKFVNLKDLSKNLTLCKRFVPILIDVVKKHKTIWISPNEIEKIFRFCNYGFKVATNWKFLTHNPKISPQFILDHAKYPWDWEYLSVHPLAVWIDDNLETEYYTKNWIKKGDHWEFLNSWRCEKSFGGFNRWYLICSQSMMYMNITLSTNNEILIDTLNRTYMTNKGLLIISDLTPNQHTFNIKKEAIDFLRQVKEFIRLPPNALCELYSQS